MSGPYLAANGLHVTDLDLVVPWYGAPVADIALATGATLATAVTLTVGNLSLRMAVTGPSAAARQRSFAGVTTARLVGGSGTWSTPVSLAPYRAPPGSSGVMLSRVLGDLARATSAGGTPERVSLASGLDRSLGPFYVPQTGAPASSLLALLAGPLWWVDFAGITQIATTRPTSTIRSQAQVEHADGGKAWLTVATEDIAVWATPGATYSSATIAPSITVAASRIRSDNEGTLRVEVLAA